jgi:hypothetical protein
MHLIRQKQPKLRLTSTPPVFTLTRKNIEHLLALRCTPLPKAQQLVRHIINLCGNERWSKKTLVEVLKAAGSASVHPQRILRRLTGRTQLLQTAQGEINLCYSSSIIRIVQLGVAHPCHRSTMETSKGPLHQPYSRYGDFPTLNSKHPTDFLRDDSAPAQPAFLQCPPSRPTSRSCPARPSKPVKALVRFS